MSLCFCNCSSDEIFQHLLKSKKQNERELTAVGKKIAGIQRRVTEAKRPLKETTFTKLATLTEVNERLLTENNNLAAGVGKGKEDNTSTLSISSQSSLTFSLRYPKLVQGSYYTPSKS